MPIDIEKLIRKNTYSEPSESFFNNVQEHVIAQVVKEDKILQKKETKVFALNFKWFAAAAVVLLAGTTAFLNFNRDESISITQKEPIIDSAYKIENEISNNSKDLIAKDNAVSESDKTISIVSKKNNRSVVYSPKGYRLNAANQDVQDYSSEIITNKDSDVEKVLVAFTSDQLKDIDLNSEEDLYLDLYN